MNNNLNNEQNPNAFNQNEFGNDVNMVNDNQNKTINTPVAANYEPVTNKKKSATGLVIGIIAFLILVAGAVFALTSFESPDKVYKRLFIEVVDDFYDDFEITDDSVDYNFNLAFNTDIAEESIKELFNKIKIGFNYQLDNKNKQMMVGINSNYGQENLLNLKLFVDAKNGKNYLYAKDYFDKYLELETDDEANPLLSLFDSEKMFLVQNVDVEKVKDIFLKELTDNLFKSENCSKENGEYVFKITMRELFERLETTIKNLKSNSAFLSCFATQEEAKSILDNWMSNMKDVDLSTLPNDAIKASLKTSGLFKKFQKLTLSDNENEIVFEKDGNKTNYKVNANGKTELSGHIKISEAGKTKKIELLVDIPTLGKITINFDSTLNKLNKIESVDLTKTKKINDLTESEMTEILEKLEDSTLYQFIMGIFGSSYDDEYYYDDYSMYE